MGTRPGLKLILVSMSRLNQNVAGGGDARHQQCRINFLPVAMVGSPAVAVYDTVPGRTNLVEEIVTS